jgi:hypothetical protein
VTFLINVELYFQVFRGDAYTVPEWVTVEDGDFETDHYFEAWGSVRLRVSFDLAFEAITLDDYGNQPEVVRNIQLSGEPRLSFVAGL